MTVEHSAIIKALVSPSPRVKEHCGREGQKNARAEDMGEVLWNTVVLIAEFDSSTLEFWAIVIT